MKHKTAHKDLTDSLINLNCNHTHKIKLTASILPKTMKALNTTGNKSKAVDIAIQLLIENPYLWDELMERIN